MHLTISISGEKPGSKLVFFFFFIKHFALKFCIDILRNKSITAFIAKMFQKCLGIDNNQIAESNNKNTKLQQIVRNPLYLKLVGLAAVVIVATTISSGLYIKVAYDSNQLKKNQVGEYADQLKSQDLAVEELNKRINFALQVENLSDSIQSQLLESKIKVNQLSAPLIEASLRIAGVKKLSQNLSKNFTDQLKTIQDTFKEQEIIIEQQFLQLVNVSAKVELEKIALSNLSNHREEYINLISDYLLKEQSVFQNLSEKQELSEQLIDSRIQNNTSELQILVNKQEKDEEVLTNIQKEVQNQSISLSNISSSVQEIETEVDDCVSSPCVNGNCTDLKKDYNCTCFAGYSSKNCDIDIDECASSPCQYGGICEDAVNSYTCSCLMGSAGTNCENEENNTFRPDNGYVYKQTPEIQDFDASREVCQSYGADLSYQAVWDLDVRQQISNALSLSHVYFGIQKIGSVWQFMNGTEADSAVIQWGSDQPASGHTVAGMSTSSLETVSYSDSEDRNGLCERKL